jgi:hypothetical protein
LNIYFCERLFGEVLLIEKRAAEKLQQKKCGKKTVAGKVQKKTCGGKSAE